MLEYVFYDTWGNNGKGAGMADDLYESDYLLLTKSESNEDVQKSWAQQKGRGKVKYYQLCFATGCRKEVHDNGLLCVKCRYSREKGCNLYKRKLAPLVIEPNTKGWRIRQFETGATRDVEDGKVDYEGFFSPKVIKAYGDYMHRHRTTSTGTRESDNWQKGIPRSVYMKSAFRHFVDWWTLHRSKDGIPREALVNAICGVLFNAMGYLHKFLEEGEEGKQ